ncbi:MAG: O-antigen ligase family protein [Candidatus Pelethousia sp.]|nr:O-antigen ligase family protein [Candidatus Pelethousia sp.]
MAERPKKAGGAKAQQEAQRYLHKVQGWISQSAKVFAAAIFLVHPLFMDSNLYYAITDAKQSFFAVCVILFACAALFFSLTASGFYQRFKWKDIVCVIRPYEWALLAYALAMIISTIFADSKAVAILGGSNRNEGLLMMLAYFGACVLVGRLYKPQEWIFYALCATAALVAGYGLCQYYGADFLGLYPVESGSQIGRAFTYVATMSNRNVASTYFCLAFCVSLVMFCGKTKKAHWAFLPIGLLLFYALLIGETESGYVGLAVGVALAFPFIASTRQAAGRFFFMIAGCLGMMWIQTSIGLAAPLFSSYWAFLHPYLLPAMLALLALAAAFFFIKLPPLPAKAWRIAWYALLIILVIALVSLVPLLAEATGNGSLTELSAILQGDLDDSFMSGRMMVWKRALSMVPDRLLFGHGPDNFSNSFNLVYHDEIFAAQGQSYDKLHNEYLQVLFDDGLLGLLSLLGFYGALLFAARKKLNSPLVLGLAVALLCHMTQALFNFVSPFAHPVAWTLWGVLGALLYGSGQTEGKKAA